MKALLAALPFNSIACGMSIIAICIGCRIEQSAAPTEVTVEVTQPIGSQQGVEGQGLPPENLPEPGGATVILVADPSDIEGRPGTSVWVTVSAFTVGGTEVGSFQVDDARVTNPLIARKGEIIGRLVQFRLIALGSTSAVISAADTTTSISIWVR